MAKNFYEKSDGRVRYEQRKKRHKASSSMNQMRSSDSKKKRHRANSNRPKITHVDLREHKSKSFDDNASSVLLTDSRRRSSKRANAGTTQILRREGFNKKEFFEKHEDRYVRHSAGLGLPDLRLLVGGAALVVLLILIITFPLILTRKKVVCELGGTMPEASAFVRLSKIVKPSFADVPFEVGTDLSETGVSNIKVHVGFMNVKTKLAVVDTTPPEVEVKDVRALVGREVNPTEFIESIKDFDKTKVAFEAMPDFSTVGEQEVSIVVADASGNGVRKNAKLTVYEDFMPPSIEGVQDLNVAIGGTISYKKGVTVSDDCDPSVKLEVDSSAVDLTKSGEYPVYYSATDEAGNNTTVEAKVKVSEPSLENVTLEYVNQKADELLARITDDSMTPYQKAEKIYWWCHDNIAYVDHTPKVSVEDGAYRGLVEHKGDCYTYAMTAKILLTQAGITNMDIERIPEGDMMHYWNLIDVGEGWKHFDTTRRADKTTFFYWDDASIKAYSDTHKGTHNYDRTKYPVIL